MAESRTCPNGHLVPPEDKVCRVCGLPVDGTSFTEPPAPPSQGRTRTIVIAAVAALVAAVVAVAVVVALNLSDDGDEDGGDGGAAQGDASVADFCGALKAFQGDLSDADPTADPAAYVKTLKDAADKLQKVGTPSDMPGDAKAGFDLTVTTISGLPDEATNEDLAKINDVSDADQAKIKALEEYIATECPDINGEPSASGSPSS